MNEAQQSRRDAAPSPSINALVDAARSAPSGDNLQPFHYRWSRAPNHNPPNESPPTETIDIHFDAARAHHVLDAAGHASRLTLGMVLGSMHLQATDLDIALDVTLQNAALALDGPTRGDGPWAATTLRSKPQSRHPLLHALPLRHTDRRLYRHPPRPVDDSTDLDTQSLLAACIADAQAPDRFPHNASPISVSIATPRQPTIQRWLLDADASLWRAPKIPQDALRWVRFDAAKLAREGDGVSWRNLGLPPALAAGVAIARNLPFALRVGAHLGGPAMTAQLLRAQLASSSAIVTIGTHSEDPRELVAAGDVALRVWARLCAAGWSAQPLTLAPILTMATRDGALHPSIPRSVGKSALDGFFNARRALGLPPQSWPAFVLRTGPNSPLPEALRPPRRPRGQINSFILYGQTNPR